MKERKSAFESKQLSDLSAPLRPLSQQISILFPELNWDLRRAGYKINAILYLSIASFVALMAFVFSITLLALPLVIKGDLDLLIGLGASVIMGILAFIYIMLIPKFKITRTGRQIDKHLEYMLKDIQIQLTAGIPLFDTFVNTANGDYGECSTICGKVAQDVQSGKSVINVLDESGLLSPSEYLRRVFWQMVNALKTGSNINVALKAIAEEIRLEKENKIRAYGQELGLWSLVYMIFVIVLPSMGVTLLLILSSFMGSSPIQEFHFWVILTIVVFFQFMFISIIKSKRPDVG
ncbi:MAG: type II secretion system F family protein [Candidatus Altiarchaeota archaeon]|nr:type II secretion system F family protein [Candidatus Altiarchaeota archaeon]